MTRWLSIIGIGEDGLDGLSAEARALVDGAQVLVGGARHLAMVPDDGRERLTWRLPLTDFVADIKARKRKRVCVLATGDPMMFGIGVTLARHVPRDQITILPGLSAFCLACAHLGWPGAEVATITLHGRPLELLHGYLQPGARLLILSENGRTPGQVAALLRKRGFGPSRLWVMEHLGGKRERMIDGTAAKWRSRKIADLNTIAVDCVAEDGAALLPRAPGLPDDAFVHDGLITKREVRATTLAALGPVPGQLLWDVGAGCGSIAIEWLRAAPGATAIAVERNAKRIRFIEKNAQSLGAPYLKIITGEAPKALRGLDQPDAVFIGGGASHKGLFEACWKALRPGGRLVANVVTLEGEAAVAAWRARVGGDLTRIAVSRAAPVGKLTAWRPLTPVTQFAARKR